LTNRYHRVVERIERMIADDIDPIGAMATAAAVLGQEFPAFTWIGFYRVVKPGLLQVGPYQGSPGCLTIEFGRGVVGTCAVERKSRLVEDVRRLDNHIACDPAARCEAVVPVMSGDGALVAVLDADVDVVGGLTADDVSGLEAVAGIVGRAWGDISRSS